jgi:hypothetical protein
MMANRTGRHLLEVERGDTSLQDAAAPRRVSSELRHFYDADVDAAWVSSPAYGTKFVDLAFRAAELSRARDYMISIVRRVCLGGQPSEERAFSQFEALVGYRQALEAMRSYRVIDDSDKAYLAVI